MLISRRKLPDVNYSENNSVSIDLPRIYPYHALNCRLTGTVTVGTADATAVVDRAPFGLIKKITIIANGKDVIKSLSGKDLATLAKINHRTAPQLTAPGVSVGAQTFVAEFPIDFARYHSKQPLDTLLMSANLSTLQLVVDWGTGSDILTPDTTTTLVFSSTKLSIHSVETVPNLDGLKPLLNKEYPIEQEVTATSSEFQIDLPVGNSFSMLTFIATDAGVRQNDIINKITIKSGQEIFFSMDANEIRQENKQDFEIETLDDGIYVVNFTKYGSLADVLPVQKANELLAVLDVTIGSGTTLIRTLTQEIITPR